MSTADRTTRLRDLDRVVADPLRFKARLRIGDDVYALKRVGKAGWQLWDTAGMASTGAAVAQSAVVAGALFPAAAPTGVMAWLGLATPAVAVTPVGWVIAAAAVVGGGYYGVTRWLGSQPDASVDVIPRFINTPIDKLGVALFDLAAGLALMVARADGAVATAERDAIAEHLAHDWGFDPAFVEAALPFLESEFDADAVEAAARATARFLLQNPDCNATQMQAELLAFLRELIAVDGKIDEREQAVVARIEAAFAEEGRWSARAMSDAVQSAMATTTAAVGEAGTAARAMLENAGSAAAKASDLAHEAVSATRARAAVVAGTARARLSELLRKKG